MSDRFTELGIPAHEITPAVSIAVNGLLEHIEQLNHNLTQIYDRMERLQNLIDTDTSPSVPNKKSFLKRLNWTIQMAHRIDEPSCVVVLDVLEFEKLEQEYGFQARNASITHIARNLANGIRDTDFFARIGESQFAAIMFFADYENAKMKAQKLCHVLANSPLFWNGADLKFLCNFGVHQIAKSDTPENALLAANNSLHIEKQKISNEGFDFRS